MSAAAEEEQRQERKSIHHCWNRQRSADIQKCGLHKRVRDRNWPDDWRRAAAAAVVAAAFVVDDAVAVDQHNRLDRPALESTITSVVVRDPSDRR